MSIEISLTLVIFSIGIWENLSFQRKNPKIYYICRKNRVFSDSPFPYAIAALYNVALPISYISFQVHVGLSSSVFQITIQILYLWNLFTRTLQKNKMCSMCTSAFHRHNRNSLAQMKHKNCYRSVSFLHMA